VAVVVTVPLIAAVISFWPRTTRQSAPGRSTTPRTEPPAVVAAGSVTVAVPAIVVPLVPPTTFSKLLWSDDFSSPKSGWTEMRRPGVTFEYARGAYRGYYADTKGAWYQVRAAAHGDVTVDVDVTAIGGPDDMWYGVVCRYDRLRGFYKLEVDPDGCAAIQTRWITSESTTGKTLASVKRTAPRQIAGSPRHLHAECVGRSLRLYVDGRGVIEATDGELTSGTSVGIVVGRGSKTVPPIEVMFDNVTVRVP
jgi:hypothetical protein